MLNNSNCSQVHFTGSVHQLNKLSKKISNGKLAEFRPSDHGTYYASPANFVPKKQGNLLNYFLGVGKTKAAAARDYLNQVKNGVTLVVDSNSPDKKVEYFVQQGKRGIEVKKLNTSV